MAERLVFGSTEANRIAAEIKYLERVERCPNCGGFAELDRFSGSPSFDDVEDGGLPLPAGGIAQTAPSSSHIGTTTL